MYLSFCASPDTSPSGSMAVGMVDTRVVGQLLPRHAIRLGAGILGGTSMATIGAAAPLFLIRLARAGRARSSEHPNRPHHGMARTEA